MKATSSERVIAAAYVPGWQGSSSVRARPQRFAVDSMSVGAALLNAAKEWARRGGATHLELDSGLARADAHRFYEREGGTRQSYSFGWEL